MVSKIATFALVCLIPTFDARGAVLEDLTDSTKVTHDKAEAIKEAKEHGATDPTAFATQSKSEKSSAQSLSHEQTVNGSAPPPPSVTEQQQFEQSQQLIGFVLGVIAIFALIGGIYWYRRTKQHQTKEFVQFDGSIDLEKVGSPETNPSRTGSALGSPKENTAQKKRRLQSILHKNRDELFASMALSDLSRAHSTTVAPTTANRSREPDEKPGYGTAPLHKSNTVVL